MGMDIYGKDPTTENGKYFRNSIWAWHPLASYIVENHKDLSSGCKSWHTNEGAGLNAEDSRALSEKLLEDVASGVAKAYMLAKHKDIADMAEESCKICEGTGIRIDAIGSVDGQPTRELSESMALKLGRAKGWCNGCDGVGTKPTFKSFYVFSLENVTEFAEFLKDSGGFMIV